MAAQLDVLNVLHTISPCAVGISFFVYFVAALLLLSSTFRSTARVESTMGGHFEFVNQCFYDCSGAPPSNTICIAFCRFRLHIIIFLLLLHPDMFMYGRCPPPGMNSSYPSYPPNPQYPPNRPPTQSPLVPPRPKPVVMSCYGRCHEGTKSALLKAQNVCLAQSTYLKILLLFLYYAQCTVQTKLVIAINPANCPKTAVLIT